MYEAYEAKTTETGMECPDCGTSVKSYQKFCPVCGRVLQTEKSKPPEPTASGFCRKCGTPYREGQHSCSNCGASLSAEVPLSGALPLSASKNPYVTVAPPPAKSPAVPTMVTGTSNSTGIAEIDAYNQTVSGGRKNGASHKKVFLILYTPDKPGWTDIIHNWNGVVHFPSRAGDGLRDVDYQEILSAIVQSV